MTSIPQLTPGREYVREIEEVLCAARCVVVIWSTNSTTSRWVQDEAREGLERGILVPVRIDQSQIPLGFRGVQTADLSDWQGRSDHGSLQRFVAAVATLVDSLPNATHVAVADWPSPRWGGLPRSTAARRATLAALAVVVLVAGISAFVALGDGSDEQSSLVATPGTDDDSAATSTSSSEEPPEPSAEEASAPSIIELGCPGAADPGQTIECSPAVDRTDASTTYRWTATGGSPGPGSAITFQTSLHSSGTQTIELTVCNGAKCDNRSVSVNVNPKEAEWGTTSWHPIENSHQLTPWCPAGSFIIAMNIDEVPSWDAKDSPRVAEALCATLAGASPSAWEDSFPVTVGPDNSHGQQFEWCPEGTYLVGLDQDRSDPAGSDGDEPIVGRALCGRPSESPYTSSELRWQTVGFTESTTPTGPWCPDGTFATRLDLDGGSDGHSYPIVGNVECGQPTQ